ncbi:MAG: gamma-glutamyl-gamma-aminobutyrate hydrolase family protein, partial [Candidatus Pacebacteria bacterium]|nr:gamma-glutamyl-gamma-aminobutyrate hydrolase family protein [Candidatus Paceibacterota bacterium]
NQKEPKTDTSHFIDIVPDSFIRLVFNSSKARVNSFHHQSVKDVAPGFKVTSLSSDNVIESIEYTKDVFITGVQWHPERMWKKDNDNLNIFRMFIDRCRILERWI